jgi:glycosyltransferase involved in cell wall biosynthesis
MKTVYNNNPQGYAEVRNFVAPNKGIITYLRKRDLFQFLLSAHFFLTGKGYHPLFKGLFFNPFIRKNKEFQFFNTILIGRNPFEVTFETTLPRLGNAPKWLYKLAIKQLVKPNCKKIYALSQCAYNLQKEYLQNEWPKYSAKILAKMEVKLPYQEPIISDYSEKKLPPDQIVFTLVGADFFRKGGMEVLLAFDQLIPTHPQLQLNIVSTLNYGDYATNTTAEDQKAALQIIQKYPKNIHHFHSLPNSKVIELYKNSHVGLLPTWADSFGYSVLEAQAAGCPCITTNIRALPEINDGMIGWIIDISHKQYNHSGKNYLSNEIKKTIIEIINIPNAVIKLKASILINMFINQR